MSYIHNSGKVILLKRMHQPCHIRGSGGSDVLHHGLDPVPAYAGCHGRQSVHSLLGLNIYRFADVLGQCGSPSLKLWKLLLGICIDIFIQHDDINTNGSFSPLLWNINCITKCMNELSELPVCGTFRYILRMWFVAKRFYGVCTTCGSTSTNEETKPTNFFFMPSEASYMYLETIVALSLVLGNTGAGSQVNFTIQIRSLMKHKQ